MAQVLRMETSFPGKSNPTSPTAFGGKEQELPYSVETPYGYRLDLDFLKYVDDIEKGHTIKRVPVHRKPRYSSLPRGYGYTGSWWTSTESLCSNASMDSRHSSFSYCGRGFYPTYGAENRAPLMSGLNARVEKTLMDAKKKLEADHSDSGDGRARLASLGSLHGSRSGSTSSLVGAGLNQSFSKMSQPGASGVYTPMSSGLSTPVSPTPGHLQHVREQMAVALRKLKQLEEQVKMIPVLQVKISVLQEEKRQLSVQLKSQKFLGHLGGFGKSKSRGELYIDIPEEEGDRGSNEVFSPPPSGSLRQDSGFETEGSVTVSPQPVQKKEVRSVSVGTDESEMARESENEAKKVFRSPPEVRSLGVSVKEQDLGLSSLATHTEVDKQRQIIQALSAKIAVLEKQLRKALNELQAAHQKLEQQVKVTEDKGQDAKPATADATSMTSAKWQEEQAEQSRGSRELDPHGSHQRHHCDQRTVGVQVYSTEHPMGVMWKHQEVPIKVDTVKMVQAPREPEIAASTATGVEMKPQRAQSLENKESYVSYKTFQAKDPEGKVTAQGQPEAPFTLYRTDEVMETSFPLPTSPSTNIFHMVKKISITSHRDEAGDWKNPAEQKGPFEALQNPKMSYTQPDSTCPDVIIVTKELAPTQQDVLCVSQGTGTGEQRRSRPAQEEEDPASSQAGIKSIMKRKEEGADSPSTKKSLQFVGVNGGYESTSSEDSGTVENVSDNESTESEYHEANEGLTLAHGESRPQGAESERRSKEGLRIPAAALPAPPAPTTSADEESKTREELSKDLISACASLQKYLENREAVPDPEMKAAYTTVLQEWLRILRLQEVDTEVVRHHIAVFRAMSPQLLQYIINMADGNGNTALHYTVSQSNFAVVKILLETGLCSVDKQNKAGYTAIMLTALAAFRTEGDMETVVQMLKLGNVNAKASQAGQTALMLAVSHGRLDMVKALLACRADVNVQDDDGSTALMCACEHGHVEIVKLLLATPGCDATLTDHDGSTALSIALEAAQKDIAVLLYAHLNFAKPPSPSSPKPLEAETTNSPGEVQ